ncbi:DUF4224 domain-containing protein [Pseudomonas massiliensis]|uniref:DUF4224 domain-containing protein n=1 Tax=Pseudomonas massiliensis TaxID=522492 RepID=UPI00059176F6|nr:DUF4224 domain-containing protein [Pseudomonas massiliensis]
METEILSEEELAEVTGYKQRHYQRRWLRDRGWRFVESRGGRPLVGRAYMRLMLGLAPTPGLVSPPPLPEPSWTPDFSRIN